MIVSCPSCGTSYKRPPAPKVTRARCGCCAGTIDLSAMRPYRIVRSAAPQPEDMERAGAHLPIGLDDPGLATRIAANVGDSAAAPLVPLVSRADVWDETESLPEIPEMSSSAPEFDRSTGEAGDYDEADRAIADSARHDGSGLAVYSFWAAGGAIVGTGTSWTLGGTTLPGMAAGGLLGLAAAWAWLRWTSRP